MRHNYIPYVLILVSCGAFAARGFSASNNAVTEVESVLDRLEQRLLEQEQGTLSFSDENGGQDHKPLRQRLNFNETSITGKLPQSDKLKELATAITTLSSDVEQLSGKIHRVRQRVMESASINNVVEFALHVDDSETTVLRDVAIKLDGFAIYNMSEPAGIWMPDGQLPIFDGPLQPGEHQIELDARLAFKSEGALPLNQEAYKHVTKTFSLVVPKGDVRRHWAINIEAREGSTPEATLKLEEERG